MQGYTIKTIQEKGVISLSKAIVRMYAEDFFFKGPRWMTSLYWLLH